MNGRSSTTTRSLSRRWREAVLPLRRALPLALAAAVAGAVAAAGITAGVVAAKPVRYVAAAEFNVLSRDADMLPLSRNEGIVAEQVARSLRTSRADEYAARAAPADQFSGEWVVGPAFGGLSYRVESDDPAVATAAAQAVYDNAGFLGFGLPGENQPRTSLDLVRVKKATPDRKSGSVTIAAATVLGGFSGLALVLLFAMPARRPESAPTTA